MAPVELWWLAAAKMPEQTEPDVWAELYEMLD